LIKQRQKKHYPVKATKLEVLKFIKKVEIITVNGLVDHFGYKPKGAMNRIYTLVQDGLLTPWVSPNQWVLTQTGEERLKYYGKKDNTTATE